jgi:hypothetical protein
MHHWKVQFEKRRGSMSGLKNLSGRFELKNKSARKKPSYLSLRGKLGETVV